MAGFHGAMLIMLNVRHCCRFPREIAPALNICWLSTPRPMSSSAVVDRNPPVPALELSSRGDSIVAQAVKKRSFVAIPFNQDFSQFNVVFNAVSALEIYR
ncbi:MAG: hypothetical protein FD120_2775 [Gammaproteobacteria bacterium]|nr:MAG: hypothetical protein FD172_3538 [Methylocystaceae bacterium]TND00583.1 MAG: hypothetical protein FD120_2775 [Gammaproteobacteria bacterium]